jgi:hypothetical protein
MRYLILLSTAFIIASTANAQIRKGQWMIGGELDFSSTSNEGTMNTAHQDFKSTTVEIAPGVAYFFANNFAGGIRFIVGSSKTTQEITATDLMGNFLIDRAEAKSNPIGISPFIRYYFLPGTKKINVFADLSYAYTKDKQKTETYSYYGPPPTGGASSSSYTNEVKGHSVSIAAGPAIFLGPKFSVELAVGYTYGKLKSTMFDNLKASQVFFGTGFNVHF